MPASGSANSSTTSTASGSTPGLSTTLLLTPVWSLALLRDLADLVGLRLLRLVRVLRPGVDLELAQHLPAERGVRQHALDRLLDHPLRSGVEQVPVGHRPQPAGVAGVPVGELLLPLVP